MDKYEKKLREELQDEAADYEVVAWIEREFPELRESEDERIRKALIEGVRQIRCKNGITQEQMVAYLEKQKVQWSEEDEKRYNDLFWILYHSKELSQLGISTGKSAIWWEDTIKWFQSFRSRPKSSDNWKPSEEQMDALESAQLMYAHGLEREDIAVVLESLYKDLKKL